MTTHPDHPPIEGGYTGFRPKPIEWYPDGHDGRTWFTKTDHLGFVGHICRFSINWWDVQVGDILVGIRTSDLRTLPTGDYWVFRYGVESFEEGREEVQAWFKAAGLLK